LALIALRESAHCLVARPRRIRPRGGSPGLSNPDPSVRPKGSRAGFEPARLAPRNSKLAQANNRPKAATLLR